LARHLLDCLVAYVSHRDLHSFPTRRSSDLGRRHEVSRSSLPNQIFIPNPGRVLGGSVRHPVTIYSSELDGRHVDDCLDRRHNERDRKSTRLNSSHVKISYAVSCLKKKKKTD